MTKPTSGGGLQVIREAVAARSSVHAIMSRDCGVGIALLGTFAAGRAELPPDLLENVVDFLWNGFTQYDAALDKLKPREQPPARSVGVLPKLEMKLPKFTMGPNQRGGPQPEVKAPKPKQRAGWIGGWR